MFSKNHWRTLSLIFVLALLMASCTAPATSVPATSVPATSVPATSVPATSVPAATPTAAAQQTGPTELNIAAIFVSALEEPWGLTWKQALDQVATEKPHGLNIKLDYTENVYGADTERILRQYAQSGKYQIIWAHSSYSDEVGKLRKEYPNILWVVAGAPNEAPGGNQYFVNMQVYEPAYLMGMLAGLMTKSNVIGAVGAFPYEDVNTPLNAFFAGAKKVNPKIQTKMTYIESWYDPAKAAEATRAQIAAGADYIYAERFGVFEAAKAGNAFAFGHFGDQNDMAADVVVSSAVANWKPDITYILDEYWKFATTGAPYNAPTKQIWFHMSDGASTLAPYHGFESKIPDGVKQQVKAAEDAILAGTLQVPFNADPVK
jgi:basic membrane protein A and related proteins